MLPWVYGFTWDAGNVIFLGAFFCIACIIGYTLGLSTLRSVRSFATKSVDRIRWESEFHDLPSNARVCRHVYSGEVRKRTCDNGFDCGSCLAHPSLIDRERIADAKRLSTPDPGFSLPHGLLYHRGHTTVRREADGTMTVGFDDLATRLLGDADSIELPSPGTHVKHNAPVATVVKGNSSVRVLAPVDGEVTERGSLKGKWLFRLKPEQESSGVAHLLAGPEAAAWLRAEFERIQGGLSRDGVGLTMADGGMPVQDLASAVPPERVDRVLGDLFLEP